jgi:hypothetical protein
MLIIETMFAVPSHDMRNHLSYIPESDRREFVGVPNGQRELPIMLSLGGIKQEVLGIKARTGL